MTDLDKVEEIMLAAKTRGFTPNYIVVEVSNVPALQLLKADGTEYPYRTGLGDVINSEEFLRVFFGDNWQTKQTEMLSTDDRINWLWQNVVA